MRLMNMIPKIQKTRPKPEKIPKRPSHRTKNARALDDR